MQNNTVNNEKQTKERFDKSNILLFVFYSLILLFSFLVVLEAWNS